MRLAQNLKAQNKLDEAITTFQECLTLKRAVSAPDHFRQTLGLMYRSQVAWKGRFGCHQINGQYRPPHEGC